MEFLILCFLVGMGYLVAHFLIYVLCLRFLKMFSEEKIIFCYHFFSCVLMGLALAAAFFVFSFRESFALAVALVGLHGIYSISFLELWSLSQAGYSLGILIRLKRGEMEKEEAQGLKELGESKIEARIRNLQRLGLVEVNLERCRLTGRGKIAAFFLKTIVFWTAGKRLEAGC